MQDQATATERRIARLAKRINDRAYHIERLQQQIEEETRLLRYDEEDLALLTEDDEA
jgi:uncharacterized coiled-coil protein SlyX